MFFAHKTQNYKKYLPNALSNLKNEKVFWGVVYKRGIGNKYFSF